MSRNYQQKTVNGDSIFQHFVLSLERNQEGYYPRLLVGIVSVESVCVCVCVCVYISVQAITFEPHDLHFDYIGVS